MDRTLRMLPGTVCLLLGLLCCSERASGQNALPDGKGKAEFVHNCTACHRADMVTKVKKTPEDWRKSVDEMASRGTDGSKEDLDNAYLYLVANFSKDGSGGASAKPATAPATSGGEAMMSFAEVERLRRAGAGGIQLAPLRVEQLRVSVFPGW